MKLPVITECNSSTLIHERYNTEWVKQKQVGVVLNNFRQISQGVKQFLEPETFARYRTNVKAIDNRAVFEVSELLQQTVAQTNPAKVSATKTGS